MTTQGVQLTRTLPPFNASLPLTVVLLDGDDEDGIPRMGVVDDSSHMKVWHEFDMQSTFTPRCQTLKRVQLTPIPSGYGKWHNTSIGGVSSTVRRVHIIRSVSKYTKPITIFAVKCPSLTSVREALSPTLLAVAIGDSEYDEEYGNVTEVIVEQSNDVAQVAAMIGRIGCTPMLEDSSVDAKRGIGVERLDRINCQVTSDETMVDNDDDIYGLRRGVENWSFSWLPGGWEVPITWDHMVRNVIDKYDISLLPQPLRQHVAKVRLHRNQHPSIGSQWEFASPPLLNEENDWYNSHPDEEAPFPLRTVITAPDDIQKQILNGETNIDMQVNRMNITCINDEWYQPVNTRSFLEKHTRGKRLVTPALDHKQSKQLIHAFYLLNVEKVSDKMERKACSLILYHYMKERGYTARWVGKYEQDANHIGNGDKFRKFSRLIQYAPSRLSVDVLNTLCGKDGKLKNRGSKGTRSKYKTNKKHYIPQRKLKRSARDETNMMHC